MTDHAGKCDICLEPIRDDDLCLTDIDLGPCHAACLEGSPMVNLDTGEPLGPDDALPVPYRYGLDLSCKAIAAQMEEAAAALRDLMALLAGFVQDEDDARSNPLGGVSLGGLMDCRDNSGCVYQSAGLAARIAKARAFTLPSAPDQARALK